MNLYQLPARVIRDKTRVPRRHCWFLTSKYIHLLVQNNGLARKQTARLARRQSLSAARQGQLCEFRL